MQKILNYLKLNIDTCATVKEWDAKASLNLQLAGSYKYYLVSMLGERFLLIRPIETQTIQRTKIHLDRIYEKTGLFVAVLLEDITAYRIKKLLEERVPFIAIDRQMYLPFMALQIRKQKQRTKNYVPGTKFTPSTQLIYLAMLYMDNEVYGAEEMAERLNVSVMTVLRAIEEMERIGLIHYEIGGKTGRKKLFSTISKKDYYRIGKEYLQNPVRKTFFVRELPDNYKFYKSGLTALAEQTMLGEPVQETYAVDSKFEKELSNFMVSYEQALEESLPKVQLMKYNIALLTNNQYVDPITLILSLDENDERVEMAIEELMEEREWYEE